ARLFPQNVHYHSTTAESKELNTMTGPRVIISASGMLTGGRVVHHLAWRLPDPKNLIALVGFQAAGTRGRKLQEGVASLRMHGREVPVRAEFMVVHGLSAHADRSELLKWYDSAGRKPRQVFVVHGEQASARALAQALHKQYGVETHTPALGDVADLSELL
ncbi:MAG: MBL fold metallo-hydrolase, partial [Candidatus Eisenbacteria bacterium]|nr:MBL fold metallo-hydrolase [Candidatus Eisenbacteria bacterium]